MPAEPVPVGADAFLGGQLYLRQPQGGHRAGTDAILLAAAAPAETAGFALDVGAGVGAAGLALAKLRPGLSVGLVENDPLAASLARENIVLNGMEERGSVHEADVLDDKSLRAAGLTSGMAQLILTNPPFLDPGRARLSADPGKRAAHAMPQSGPKPLAEWIAACLGLLADGGLFLLIHKPGALGEILAALGGRAGAVTLLPVQARADTQATRVLVRAKKGGRAPLCIAPALVLHDDRGFSPQIERINRGAAFVGW